MLFQGIFKKQNLVMAWNIRVILIFRLEHSNGVRILKTPGWLVYLSDFDYEAFFAGRRQEIVVPPLENLDLAAQ
jgi:hypothetical protein